MILAIGSNDQYAKLCNFIKASELISDKRFETNQERLINREALVLLLQEKINLFNRIDFLNNCHELGIPAGAINNLQEVFASEDTTPFVLEDEQEGVSMRLVRSVVFELIEKAN